MVGLGRRVTTDIAPPVAVIVAVKGSLADTFDEFLVRLFEQDYPRFRAIFAIESVEDPAMAILNKCRTLAPDRVTRCGCGHAVGQGQKTANLSPAVSHFGPTTRFLCLLTRTFTGARLAVAAGRPADAADG